MKRTFALVLALMMLLMLAACGSGEPTPNSDTPSETATPTESPETEATNETEPPTEPEISFEEITVVDNEQCLIKITGIEPDNMWGYTLNVYLENKSAEKTYMFSVESAAVNGVQTDPFFAAEVAAEKKSKEAIHFSDSDLSDNGIGDFTDIELTFRVYDSEDWSAENVARETVHIYPLGQEKAAAFVRESQPTDTVIVDNDSTTVIVTGYEENDIWGYTVRLYLVNKTGEELTYGVDEASVNGFMADPFWATTVGSGKAAFSTISWSDSALEENDITSVEEIEMKLRIYSSEDWSADPIFNETITLNP